MEIMSFHVILPAMFFVGIVLVLIADHEKRRVARIRAAAEAFNTEMLLRSQLEAERAEGKRKNEALWKLVDEAKNPHELQHLIDCYRRGIKPWIGAPWQQPPMLLYFETTEGIAIWDGVSEPRMLNSVEKTYAAWRNGPPAKGSDSPDYDWMKKVSESWVPFIEKNRLWYPNAPSPTRVHFTEPEPRCEPDAADKEIGLGGGK